MCIQAGLELVAILQPLPSELWYLRGVPPCLALGFDSLRRSPGFNFLSSRLSLLSAENSHGSPYRASVGFSQRAFQARALPAPRGHCLLLPPLHPWSVLVWRLTLLLRWTDTISQPPLVLRLLNEPLSPPSEKGLPWSAASQGNQGQAYRGQRRSQTFSQHPPRSEGRGEGGKESL